MLLTLLEILTERRRASGKLRCQAGQGVEFHTGSVSRPLSLISVLGRVMGPLQCLPARVEEWSP